MAGLRSWSPQIPQIYITLINPGTVLVARVRAVVDPLFVRHPIDAHGGHRFVHGVLRGHL